MLCHTSCHHQGQQRQDSALSTHSGQLLGLGAAGPCKVSCNSLIRGFRVYRAVRLRCWPDLVYLLAKSATQEPFWIDNHCSSQADSQRPR